MQIELKNKIFISFFIVIVATGCAGRQHPQTNENHTEAQTNNIDPFESYNRSIYRFNTTLDRYLLKPLAKTYRKITPNPVESGIHKFFENLEEPGNIVNGLLQGKFDRAGISTGRFVLNTTVGVLGFFDVAGKLDIPKHNEDFGQTLSAWGVPSGPYMVLPLFGPRYLRHSGGMIADAFLDPIYYVNDDTVRYALIGLEIIKTRARLLGADDLVELQLDPYVFVRESYLQRRQAAINDAEGVESNNPDEFDDEFEDELENEN